MVTNSLEVNRSGILKGGRRKGNGEKEEERDRRSEG